jgi:hypothetical protein
MRTRSVLLALLVVLPVLCGVVADLGSKPAYAAPILDQSFLTGVGSVSGDGPFSQTFTIGIAGTLSSVAVSIFGVKDMTVDIRPTTTLGVPLVSDDPADQLGRVTVPTRASFPFLVSVDVSPFGIAVRPGDVLAIVLQSDGVQNWRSAVDGAATYTGGEGFLKSGTEWKPAGQTFFGSPFSTLDFDFQTFVAPIPEPTTLLLFGTTAAGLGLVRWRQRRCKRREPVTGD